MTVDATCVQPHSMGMSTMGWGRCGSKRGAAELGWKTSGSNASNASVGSAPITLLSWGARMGMKRLVAWMPSKIRRKNRQKGRVHRPCVQCLFAQLFLSSLHRFGCFLWICCLVLGGLCEQCVLVGGSNVDQRKNDCCNIFRFRTMNLLLTS